MVNVGDKIRELRMARHWSLPVLSKESGINPSTIQSIEVGRTKKVDYQTLVALSKALDVNPEDLTRKEATANKQIIKALETEIRHLQEIVDKLKKG